MTTFAPNIWHIKMDSLSIIKEPIKKELDDFIDLFNTSLSHSNSLQEEIFSRIRKNAGKRMRPMLMLLVAKNFGEVNSSTLEAAVGLELLHTASLIHDDVVDESAERRGIPSVNALHDNKVAVLVGDYILSTALLHISKTQNLRMVTYLARLGQTLSNGEILQLMCMEDDSFSEQAYYQVIRQKTAALFEACCVLGAVSVDVKTEDLSEIVKFGQTLGVIFQIRDDIFDYYDSTELGKPTGNDMLEGKLTLPVIYALNSTGNKDMLSLAMKVRNRTISPDEIATLVEFTKENGGIEYAQKRMQTHRLEAQSFIDNFVKDEALGKSFEAYLDFVVRRNN